MVRPPSQPPGDDQRPEASFDLTQALASLPSDWQQTVWELGADAMVLSDPQGYVISVNQAYCQLHGDTHEALVGQPFTVIFPPDQRAAHWASYQRVFQSGASQPAYRATIQRSDGSLRFVESRIEFLYTKGQRVAMLSIVRDVSTLVEAEQALRDKNILLERIMATTPDLMYIYDLIEERNVFANYNLYSMLGYTAEEVQHMGAELLPNLLHPEDMTRVPSRHARFSELTDGTITEHEYRMRAADGQWRWLRSRDVVFRRDAHGRAWQTLGIAQDITRQKQAEAEHQAMIRQFSETQKLESLGLLASGVAHDFNNLLMAIRGNAELALNNLPHDHRARYDLGHVLVACQQAAELTSQMLAYAGQGQIVLRPLDVNVLITELAALLRAAVPRTTTLQTNLTVQSLMIHADPAQIRQIVLNLVVNAAEAIGHDGGQIMIQTTLEDLSALALRERYGDWHLQAGSYVLLRVADNGSGMDAATRERMFEPFFTTKSTGRGLGMAAAQGIVRSHGGTIAIDSTLGVGTTISVLLPAHVDTKAALVREQPGQQRLLILDGSILVIEDEVAIRRVTARMLEWLGYTVNAFGESRAALAALEADPAQYALVLTDLTMPPPAGAALIRLIRAIRAELPIIVMTGYTTHPIATQLSHEARLAVLAKPFSATDLQRAIQDAMIV